MPVSISIKERSADTGQWCEFTSAKLSGKTLGDLFTESAGKEIVAEVTIDGQRHFFCGTEHWRERMERKGKAILFSAAAETLLQRNRELLAETIPGIDDLSSVFGDCRFNSVTFEE